jgi:molecular chaperone GrpE
MPPKPKKKKAEKKESKSKEVAELEAKLKEEREKAEMYLNQLKYARADLVNLRKQMQKRIDEEVDRGTQRIMMRLLPIVEEFDLAIEAAREAGENSLLEGVEMVRRKLEKMLDSEGVSPIEALGRAFDPHLHEAVLEVETDEHEDGTVVEEIRRGYLYKGRVLRASMVKVARNKNSDEEKGAKEDG